MISFIGWLIFAYFAYKIIRRKLCRPDFKDKTVWITGASSGLGEYLAYEFSRRGTQRLILSARNMEELERVKGKCSDPSKVQVLKMDMVDFDNVRQTTSKVIEDLQKDGMRLDVVVENAGVGMKPDFINFPFENHQAMINLNVHGPYNHIQSFIHHMMKNKTGQIVAIDSILGKFANANRSSYCASKYAVNAMMDSLRSEVHHQNIKVTTICPGYIQSNVGENSFVSKVGEKCGVRDPIYHLGMKTQDFATETVKAIYMGENELHVSSNWIQNPFRILLRGISPDLSFIHTALKSKKAISDNVNNYYKSV